MRVLSGRRFDWVGGVLLAAACNNPGGSTTSPNSGTTSGAGTSTNVVETGDGGSSGAVAATQPVAVFASFTPQGVVAAGGSGGMGTVPQAIVAPFGVSSRCGDAIVGPTEECDDGDNGSDACTDECQTRDQAAAPALEGAVVDRYLGAGRHPVSGLADGFIAAYVEQAGEEPTIGATVFNIWGQATGRGNVSEGASPIDEANPVAVALPSGKYAVAWSDFDGDGSDLGVALRLIQADGTLAPLQAANAGREFSQLNPDALWTGTELVVAWEDHADAFNGPDLRYRLFDQDLRPLSDDLTLADSSLPEAAVALATFNGAWAAAYREGTADGKENIVVKVGTASFRVGLVSGGPLDDRPALVGLDATHWLVAFSEGTDPAATGVHNVPRLRYAVIDTQSDVAPVSQALEPLDDVFRNSNQIAQLSPTLETTAEGAYIAWRSEARPGDAAGDQIWLKLLRWLPDETAQLIRGEEAELLIPRTCDGSIGDQRRPALARVGLPPSGALAIAWDDYSRSQGVSAGDPDVVVHYTPLHERLPEHGSVFVERFTGSNGAAWSSHWSRETYGSGTLLHSIQGSEGRVYSSAGAGGVLMRVNDHNALNVLMDVDVRFDLNASRSDLVARRDDADPDTYLAVRFGDYLNGKWEIYALIDGVKTVIVDRAMPYAFPTLAQDIDYHMQGRIETLPNGSLVLSAKFWEVDLGETQAWTMASTLSAANTGALGQVYSRFVNRSGRFGLLATLDSVNRTVTFDDFKAVFYEGSLVENLDAVTDAPAPLLRRPAAYRVCTPEEPCAAAQGCCEGDAECGAGLACASSTESAVGLGSHSNTCAAAHCSNQRKDADEVRADCGGADCLPCDASCPATIANGNPNYCSATCPCGSGEGDCVNTQCKPGLTCLQRGDMFGLVLADDVCVPQHCHNRQLDADLGEGPTPDCGGDCGACVCRPAECTVWCPCPAGGSHCDLNDECVAGLICGQGTHWPNAVGRVCQKQHCTNGKKDADETGVDCGGADCGPACP